MDKKNIMPNPAQPVDRVPTGQLPSALMELSEEALDSSNLLPLSYWGYCSRCTGSCSTCSHCSYDGDNAE